MYFTIIHLFSHELIYFSVEYYDDDDDVFFADWQTK
jgi:hypothetical protein